MGLFNKKKEEEKIPYRLLPETKDNVLSVVNDYDMMYEFLDDYAKSDSNDPMTRESLYIGALSWLANPEGSGTGNIILNRYYDPIRCNNILYYTYQLLKDLDITFLNGYHDDGNIYRLVYAFASLLDYYVNEKTYEEFIDFESNPCLAFANYIYNMDIASLHYTIETDFYKYMLFSFVFYVVNAYSKGKTDVFEKDSFLLDDSFYSKVRRHGLEDLFDEFKDRITYKECLEN